MRLTLASLAACATASAALAQQGTTEAAAVPEASATTTLDGTQEGGAVIEIPGLRKLRIGGQYRLRYENRYNYDFNSDVSDNDDFFTQRFRLELDMEFNEELGAYVQLQDVRNWGEEAGGTVSRSAPGFDFHQAYFQAKDFPGIGGESRIGRQVLAYGSHRLVGSLEWLSQGRSFDGVRHRWTDPESYRLDAFVTQVRETPGTANSDEDAWFMGAYGTWFFDHSEGDLYVLYRHDNKTAGAGLENRVTIGGRYQGNFDAFELEAEAATQWGEEDGADIPLGETYALHLHGQLDLGDELPPYIRAELDAASGDDPTTADNERFDTLYPTAHRHLGMMDFVFWENIFHVSLAGGIRPSERTKLQVAWHWFQAMEEGDAVFGPNGGLTTGGAGFDKDLGHEIDVLYDLDLGTTPVKTSLQFGYGIFLPGDGVKDSTGGFDDLAHFVYAQGFAVF